MQELLPSPQRGQIWYIRENTEKPAVGDEIWSNRPALIVSADTLNANSNVVMVVYLSTSRKKRISPTHVPVTSCNKTAIALCEQIHSVDTSRLDVYMDNVSDTELKQINDACILALGISTSDHGTGLFRKWENYISKYNLNMDISDKTPVYNEQELLTLISNLEKERDSYKQLYESKAMRLEQINNLSK